MVDGEDSIIHGAVRGESSAFGQLYDHYQPQIYRFVFLKVGQREEAEDLTHQVFLSAWEKITTYNHRGFPFSSWLYQIARNIVVDHYRSRRNTVTLDDVDPELFAIPAVSHEALDEAMNTVRVARCIKELKPDYQDVIIMRFIEEFSIKEVAAAMQKSEGAVKLMQHRAIKELKSKLVVA